MKNEQSYRSYGNGTRHGWTECDEKFWWPTETIILFLLVRGDLSLVCVFIIAIFFTFFTDFFFLPFALSLRIVLYICCVDCVEEKNVLSFLSSKILLNENVANCTRENFQGEKKFNKPLAPDALHQCALHYLHYTVSELKLVNCAISRALCHKLL